MTRTTPRALSLQNLLRKAPYEGRKAVRYVNPNVSVKMSDVSEHSDSEFYHPTKKKRVKRGGHLIKCSLTELDLAGRENICYSVMAHGPRCTRSIRHDLGPNIPPYGPPTRSISPY